MATGQNIYTFSKITNFGEKRKFNSIKVITQLLRNYLPSNGSVLEVGPGRGELAQEIVKSGYKYIGIEPSGTLREKLIENKLNILSDPIPTLGLADAEVDLVYSYDVIEHLQTYLDVLKYFEESYRVLKPNGTIVSIAPNVETIGKLFYMYEYQHSFITTINRIETMLQETGFEVVKADAFLTNFGLSSNILLRTMDRLLANITLMFMCNGIVINLLRVFLGKGLVFKVHKNLYDHIIVIGKKLDK